MHGRSEATSSALSVSPHEGGGRSQIATILLQDYFQHPVFSRFIGERQWSRFESRLERNVAETCALLAAHGVTATFFSFGWIAERYPSVIAEIAAQGHEIADGGYGNRDIAALEPEELRKDLRRSRAALEAASGRRVAGFRSYRALAPARLPRILDILIEEGYRYDASLRPSFFDPAGRSRRFPYVYRSDAGSIIELPIPTARVLGVNLPIGGGNYVRQLPRAVMFPAYERWIRAAKGPFVLYFHPWELDPDQPRISAIPRISRIRQYRNLGRFRTVLPDYLAKGGFGSARDYLGIADEPAIRSEKDGQAGRGAATLESPSAAAVPVTVVIPCYNETSSLSYLRKNLEELEEAAAGKYALSFILVDDCSTDGTEEHLRRLIGGLPNYTVIRHEVNRGVAGAIRTGIEAARTDIVCSMDADCSYDPLDLLKMIPMLAPSVQLITASPYHTEGSVLGVPAWRLFLSRGLSGIYRRVLPTALSTYTSCFRVYRRDAVLRHAQTYGDFRGVLETLVKMDLAGATIREFPTTLQTRVFGYSKMKTLKTIAGHLGLFAHLVFHKRPAHRDTPPRLVEKGNSR